MLKVYDMFSGIGGFALGFQKEGFEVTTSSDGSKGIELAKKLLPDLIILDVILLKKIIF